MLKAGLIRDSSSKTSSPLLVVKSHGGKFRVTQDVTVLNKMMRTVHGTIPCINGILEKFAGMKYLGCFDLIAAYHQMPAHEDMRQLWAFSTPWGIMEYCDRLPMGDKNVCVVFNDIMIKMVAGLDNCAVYFDDIIFGAESKEELLRVMRRILERLEKYNVKISRKKMRVGFAKLDILGYALSASGYKPKEENVEKFLNEGFPTTEGIRHWLGLLNVFSKFVPNYAEIREPFRHAVKKGGSLMDNDETRAAFVKAKEAVAGIQQLFHLDGNRDVFLDCDASDYGIGGCLYHKDDDGQKQPILFSAHLLTELARSWSTKKKEAYAIFKTLEDMQYLLRGREFILRTDHRNLLFLSSHMDQVEHRWYQWISEFSFKLELVPGVENVVVDPLSRMFAVQGVEKSTFGGIHRAEVLEYFTRSHNINVGHLGINKTVDAVRAAMIRENVEVPRNLRTEVAELIAACMLCSKARKRPEKPVLLPHALHGGRFFERIQLDFLEGLPKARDGCAAILVIVCTWSKFVMLFPVIDKTAEVTKQCLLYCMGIFGHPVISVSDGGPAFKAEEFECLCAYAETEVHLTHPHRPSAHGMVERVHQEVMKHLGHILHALVEAEEAEWPSYIVWVQRIINNTVNSSTGYAPVTLVFGSEHVNDAKVMEFSPSEDRGKIGDYDAFVTNHNRVLSLLQTESNRCMDNALLKRMEAFREAEGEKCNSAALEVGSYAMVRKVRQNKLTLKWLGPFRVVEELQDNFYKLKDITQDYELLAHREDIRQVECSSEAEALEYARLDSSEMTIEEVVGHQGNPQQPSTMTFTCKCEGFEKPILFAFSACKLVGKVKEYIAARKLLKPLSAKAHYGELKFRKKSRKLTSSLMGHK